MIGHSLSFCVRDIAVGLVDFIDVQKIVTGTAAKTEADWDRLLEEYSIIYWRGFDARARRVVAYLRTLDMIEQPRLEGKPPPDICAQCGTWSMQ